jgi:16S rRNA (cytidine1402-2'-O)-methyltransferase
MAGTLILCATPIGNLGDISTRLSETLGTVDVIFAEDTRRTGQLLRHLGLAKPMRSYFAGNERGRNEELRVLLAEGRRVALVSDAGMPVVSDPGRSAVAIAVDVGATVTAIPGPSAPVMAIAVSGFNGDRFVFEGFLPRKGTDRTARLASIATEERTVVLFSATRRIGKDLADLAQTAGIQRNVVVGRELTKLYEEIWRGTLGDAATVWGEASNPKGEFTIVVEGAAPTVPDIERAVAAVQGLIAEGASASDAIKTISKVHAVAKNDLYDAVTNSRPAG